MENQDKIYEQFKEAAGKAENKSFDRMDAVWNRVEEKLDDKKKRRGAILWRYGSIAAVLLIMLALGEQFFRNHTVPNLPEQTPETKVTTIDRENIEETFNPTVKDTQPTEAVVVTEDVKPEQNDSPDTTIDIKNAMFTTSKTVDNPKYDFKTHKIKLRERKVYQRNYSNIALEESSDVESGNIVTSKEDKFSVQNSIHFGKTTVTGIVSDKTGPLPLATIGIKGSSKKIQADYDGSFSIEADKNDEIEVSFIGYGTQTIPVNGNTKINITLSEDDYALSEVVVDRYRSTTTSTTAAAVTTVSPNNNYNNRSYRNGDTQSIVNSETRRRKKEPLEDRANASVIKSLQGQIAGLNITTAKGQPGSDSTVVLRGAGTINRDINPLFVVDGIPVDEDAFRSLNQNDIASFSILKDAAATSIYGNRGANGVIVVKTKNTAQSAITSISIEQTEPDNEEIKNFLRSTNTMRGSREPLYIVDGISMDGDTFRKLNPNDIETIRVLKDASSIALYGNRGSNGVVVIKTRQSPFFYEYKDEKATPDKPAEPETFHKIQVDQEDYEMLEENAFENPALAPLSTFSIDVDNASYTNIRRFINNGQTVPKDAVRVEEMINFFKYNYPEPKGDVPFSINTEYSDAPWNTKHKLLKIGLEGVDIPTNNLPASNFVFLIDVSGSMNSYNKLPLLKQSMKLLVNQMRDEDKIAIVVYSGAAGMVLPPTNGSEKATIINALDKLEAGGSTAGGVGIELAYKTAQENFIKGGNNRIILATDGDFNVGMTSNRDMETLIEEKRKSGVFLTCLGYGMGNYKDSKMEILADKGNGNYAYIDSMQEADRFLQKEFKGSMYAIAKDVKIQIEFNPKHVQSYRLIGYENRKLRDEDFANDAIDAGELGSGHTVTALYEIIPIGVESDYFTPAPDLKYSQPAKAGVDYSDELATIKFRHKKPDGNKSKETIQIIANRPVTLQQASDDFKFAAAVAWFGLKLRDSKLVPDNSSNNIIKLAKEGLKNDPDGYRAEFIRLIEMVE